MFRIGQFQGFDNTGLQSWKQRCRLGTVLPNLVGFVFDW